MRILLVGGGGREHAIAWKLKQDDPEVELFAAPGNAGIAGLARCRPVSATDIAGLFALAESEGVDFTIVGPEAPLSSGIVDEFERAGKQIFGPTRSAARLESSKRFAKELMLTYEIPTGHATWHRDSESAKRAVRELGAPVVIKASGLAGGKGVVVCGSISEADQALDAMLHRRIHGDAGLEVLVEEFLQGEELSLFALCDGGSMLAMLPLQDHKRLLADDEGPNTGGMGAYAPVGFVTPDLVDGVSDSIIQPLLQAMQEARCPFRGLLYCGLMITGGVAKVIEFNCRFGDPETEALMPLMKSPLLPLLRASATDSGLGSAGPIEFSSNAAVTTVVASAGYPEQPRTGDPIQLPNADPSVLFFHCGTRRGADGALLTAGGRVLAVTAIAAEFEDAQRLSARAASKVHFEGSQFRPDIGWREVRRRAGVA